jgi:hypothetical protein
MASKERDSMWQMLENITHINRVNVSKEERSISLLVAIPLLIYVFVRIPLTAVLALFAAGYLILRGLRGYCYIYEQLGLNTAVSLPARIQQP